MRNKILQSRQRGGKKQRCEKEPVGLGRTTWGGLQAGEEDGQDKSCHPDHSRSLQGEDGYGEHTLCMFSCVIPRLSLVSKTWGSFRLRFVLAERSERLNEILLYKYM